jgi:hypothetical protein
VSSTAPIPGSAARNKSLAEAEAARLLGEVRLPARAAALGKLPDSLNGPAAGVPSTSSLIDKTRSWHVPMALDAAVAWVQAHPPAGLTLGATASGGGPGGVEVRGFEFEAPDSAAWRGAQLQIGVATLPTGDSAIRADGIALWIDPRPMKDAAPGRRIHLTVNTGCPASDRGVAGVTNAGAGDLTERMVPTASPAGGLLCRYAGLNGTPSAVVARRRLTATEAQRIAALAAAISFDHLDNEAPHSGPGGDGSATVLVLAYPGRDVDLWYPRGGCAYLSNGDIRTVDEPAGFSDFSTALSALGG